MDFTHEEVIAILNRIEDRLSIMRKRKYEFYSECGLSSAAYSLWKTGKNTPSAAMLKKIANYLNVSYDWLITGEENDDLDETNLEIRKILRERPEVKILFDTSKDAPASTIYEAIALIMKGKGG